MMKERKFSSVEELKASLAEIVSLDQIPHPEPVMPSELAQEMIDSALTTRGRARLKLARAVLQVWPDCAEAYVLQAELRQNQETRLDLYRRGVAAGERALGPLLDEKAGELWDILLARPYLRALQGLAETLLALNRLADAAGVLREMLGLETRDPARMRDLLTSVLLVLGHDTEARELLDRYGEDSAWPAYSRALLDFRQGGDSLRSRRYLHKALKANGAVPLYLLDLVVLPTQGAAAELPEPVGEALAYSTVNFQVWRETPGALEWLEEIMVDFEPGGSGPKRRPGKKAMKRARKR
jgi:tetratricopeptide (TPR) repeat protein